LSEATTSGTNEYLFRQDNREPELGSTRGSLAVGTHAPAPGFRR
jgi:hypothetical protein